MGLPGPGEPLLIAAGVLAAQHKLDIGSVIFVAWAGATAGGIVGWLAGKGAGRRLITAPGPFHAAAVACGASAASGSLRAIRWSRSCSRLRGSPASTSVEGRIYHPTNAISAALWAAGIGFGAYLVGPTVVDAVDDLGTVLEVDPGSWPWSR